MVEGIREPPKELRAFGRLNCRVLGWGLSWGRGLETNFYGSDFVLDAEFNVGVLVLRRHGDGLSGVLFGGIAKTRSWNGDRKMAARVERVALSM
jgi:hypothetical protein